MRLLVSVANAEEATAALQGGADIVDAKDPHAGPLGAVSLDTLRDIRAAVATRRPVSAALGDADDGGVEHTALAFGAHASLVKVGLTGTADAGVAASVAAAAVRGASARQAACGVVLVAYADQGLTTLAVIEAAARAGAAGVLIDTADKQGPALPCLLAGNELARLAAAAHDRGLTFAVAGKLDAQDFTWVGASGADIVGVRSAACESGRTSRVSAARVRALKRALEEGCS